MAIDNFAARTQTRQSRADQLQDTVQNLKQSQAVPLEVFEEWQRTVEELRVAEEELRQQNEELQASRQAAEAERQRYQELFDLAPDSYVVTDQTGIIMEANRAAAALLNVPQHFLVGKPLSTFTTEAEQKTFYIRLNQLLQTKQTEEWDIRLQPRGRAPIEASLTVSPASNAEGKIVGARWLLRDIAQRKQVEEALRLSEERFSKVFHASPAPISISTLAEGRFLDVNNSFFQLIGYSREEVIGRTSTELQLWVDPEERNDLVTALRAHRSVHDMELKVRTKAGEIRNTLASKEVVELGGRPCVLSMLRDITERKQAEEALRNSEERYRIISQMISDYAFSLRLTEQGRIFIEWLTESFTSLTGYSVAEFSGRPDPWRTYIHPDDLEHVSRTIKTATPGTSTVYEFRIIRKDKSIRWLLSHIHAVEIPEGDIRIYGSTQDITERKQAEEEVRKLNAELEQRVLERTTQLRESEARYRQLFENANDAITIMSLDGHFLEVNQKTEELTGLPKEAFIGQTMEMFFPGRLAESRQKLEQAVREGKVGPYTLEILTPLGSKTFSTSTFSYFKGGVPAGTMSIGRDVTEEIRQKQEREILYQFAHELVHLTDIRTIGDHLFTHARKLLGADYGDFMLVDTGRTVLRGVATYGVNIENFHKERIDAAKESAVVSLVFQKREPIVIKDYARNPLVSKRLREKYYFLQDAWAAPLISGGKLVGIFCVGYLTPQREDPEKLRMLQLLSNEAALALERARLIDELRESEQRFRKLAQERERQLIVSDRLVSAGELAASLAHEFNNPLSIILGFADDLLTEVNSSDSFYRPLAIIQEEAQRCRKLVRDLLNFARPAPAHPDFADLGEIIHKSLELISSQLQKGKVTAEINLQPDLPLIYVDAQQLQQVLLNLFFNALEAMPNGGMLSVRVTTPAPGSGSSVEKKKKAIPEVCIAVADTGIGISVADLKKIFHPFFTAKKSKGMGLGLSICEGIVKTHGGRIEVESRLGQGTTFSLFFPLKSRVNKSHG